MGGDLIGEDLSSQKARQRPGHTESPLRSPTSLIPWPKLLVDTDGVTPARASTSGTRLQSLFGRPSSDLAFNGV